MPLPRVRCLSPAAVDLLVLAHPAGRELLHQDGLAAPDLILTHASDPVRGLADGAGQCPSLLLTATTIEGVFDDLLRLGEALDSEPFALASVVRLRERLHEAGEHINPFADGEAVLMLHSADPLRCAGRWCVQLLERAGARHPWNPTVASPVDGAASGPQSAQRTAPPGRVLSWDEIARMPPDRLIVAHPGVGMSVAAWEALRQHPLLRSNPRLAMPGRIALLHDGDLVLQPGPGLVDAYEWLVSWLHDLPALAPQHVVWRAGRL